MVKRVTEFETDGDGRPKLVADVEKLCTNARYERAFRRRDKFADRLKGNMAVADWVRNAVIGDLETLDGGITCRPDPKVGGGNFLLLIGCLMAIEYFATIFDKDGKRAVDRAVSYARQFMSDRYAACMPALMTAARNGIAHGSWPARVGIDGINYYPFAIGYEHEYPNCVHLHISLHQDEHEAAATEKLYVNPRILLADLRESVMREPGGLREWILSRPNDDEAITKRSQPSLIDWSETDLSEWR